MKLSFVFLTIFYLLHFTNSIEVEAQSKAYSSSQPFLNKYGGSLLYNNFNYPNSVFPKYKDSNSFWWSSSSTTLGTTSTTTTSTPTPPIPTTTTEVPGITYLVTSGKPVTFDSQDSPYAFDLPSTTSNSNISSSEDIDKTSLDDNHDEEYVDAENKHGYGDDEDEEEEEGDGDGDSEDGDEESDDSKDEMKDADKDAMAKNPLNFLNLLGTDFQPGRLVNIFFGLIVMLFMMIAQGYAMWVFGIAFLPGTRSIDSDWQFNIEALEPALAQLVDALEYWENKI